MSAVRVCLITDMECSRGCGVIKPCVLDADARRATVTPRSAMPPESQLPPMADAYAQIIYALQRAEASLRQQGNALCDQMDYSAEFFGEDADRMNEAIALVTAAAINTGDPSALDAKDTERLDFMCNDPARYIEHDSGMWRVYEEKEVPAYSLERWVSITPRYYATPREAIDVAMLAATPTRAPK